MRSQGRQGDGTPKGLETRNVTIDLQREFIVFGGQVFAPGNVYLRHTPLADGRRVKFTYQELLVVGAFIAAQIADNEVVYSVC